MQSPQSVPCNKTTILLLMSCTQGLMWSTRLGRNTAIIIPCVFDTSEWTVIIGTTTATGLALCPLTPVKVRDMRHYWGDPSPSGLTSNTWGAFWKPLQGFCPLIRSISMGQAQFKDTRIIQIRVTGSSYHMPKFVISNHKMFICSHTTSATAVKLISSAILAYWPLDHPSSTERMLRYTC